MQLNDLSIPPEGGGGGGSSSPVNVIVLSRSTGGAFYTVPVGRYAIITATISGTAGTTSNIIRVNGVVSSVNVQAGTPIVFKLVAGQYIFHGGTTVTGYIIEEYNV